MLFVGIASGAGNSPLAARLAGLGGVTGQIGAPPAWDAAQAVIVVFGAAIGADEQAWPGLHLVLGDASSPGARPAAVDARVDPDRAAGQPAASAAWLWAHRIVPFEANLRAGRRAARRQQAELCEPDPSWPEQASRLTGRLRAATGTGTGSEVIRVDHIGSTSVPGLPAKQLIDIQVVVAGLDAAARVAAAARRAGFVHVAGQWSGTDRHGAGHPEEVAVDADPGRPVNVNIRPVTAPVWRETLLLRDYLRGHPAERDDYAAMKQQLAARPASDVNAYSADKMPWISAALGRAEAWAARAGWTP